MYVLRRGSTISWRNGFNFRRTDRFYRMCFTWQGYHYGVRILRKSVCQRGDTCSRYAAVRAIEYRKRIQYAKSSQNKYMLLDNSIRRPSDSNAKFDYPIKMKRRRFPRCIFPRLSFQQVVDHARNRDPNFRQTDALNISFVLRYMKRRGVTFERFYPTVVNEAESDNENVEGEENDSEWEEVDNIIEEADDENVKGQEVENIDGQEDMENVEGQEEVENINEHDHRENVEGIDGQEDMENVEGEEEVENIHEHDHRENVEGEEVEGDKENVEGELELVNINREDKADEEIVEGEVEAEENIEGKSEAEAVAAAEADVSEIAIATAVEVEAEAEAKVEDEAGWEVKKRLYLLGWITLVPEHGKRKFFFNLVVRHCLKGGPVIGEVACSDDFATRFYSKKGYDFILKIEKQDEGLNLNRAKLVRDKEEPETDIAVEGHLIVIIGYGFVRRRLRLSDPRLRKLRREFFLVQDSSLPTAGSFQNGLAIVFSSSVRKVHVPFFSGLYRRKTEWQKEQEEKNRERFWKNLFKKN